MHDYNYSLQKLFNFHRIIRSFLQRVQYVLNFDFISKTIYIYLESVGVWIWCTTTF